MAQPDLPDALRSFRKPATTRLATLLTSARRAYPKRYEESYGKERNDHGYTRIQSRKGGRTAGRNRSRIALADAFNQALPLLSNSAYTGLRHFVAEELQALGVQTPEVLQTLAENPHLNHVGNGIGGRSLEHILATCPTEPMPGTLPASGPLDEELAFYAFQKGGRAAFFKATLAVYETEDAFA